MLQGEHSALLSTLIKLPVIIKIFVLSFLSGHFSQVLLYNETRKVHCAYKGSHVRISKLRYISVPEYCFYYLSNSADPGVMLHSVAFQLVLVLV